MTVSIVLEIALAECVAEGHAMAICQTKEKIEKNQAGESSENMLHYDDIYSRYQ
jgi:hypothetical protein